MSLTGVGQTFKIDKTEVTVQKQSPVQNGKADSAIVSIKGEEFSVSGKNVLNKGKVANVNVLEAPKEAKVKGSDVFNAGMLGAMFGSVTSIGSSIAVSHIPGLPAPAKFAIVAASSLAVGGLVTHKYLENAKSFPTETKEEPKSAKINKNLETGLVTGFGAFIGASFGFFTSVGLANTGALGFGTTMIVVPAIGAVAGGALGYYSAKKGD